jgi:hypothetical protein
MPENARQPQPEQPETRSVLTDVVLPARGVAANFATTALAIKALKEPPKDTVASTGS